MQPSNISVRNGEPDNAQIFSESSSFCCREELRISTLERACKLPGAPHRITAPRATPHCAVNCLLRIAAKYCTLGTPCCVVNRFLCIAAHRGTPCQVCCPLLRSITSLCNTCSNIHLCTVHCRKYQYKCSIFRVQCNNTRFPLSRKRRCSCRTVLSD